MALPTGCAARSARPDIPPAAEAPEAAMAACGFQPAGAGRARSEGSPGRQSRRRWFICSKSPWMDVPSRSRTAPNSRPVTAVCSFATPASISALRNACATPIGWTVWMASGSARSAARHQLQQPAARPLPIHGARQRSERTAGRNLVGFRTASAFLRNRLVPLLLRRSGRRGNLGPGQFAAPPDSPALRARAG